MGADPVVVRARRQWPLRCRTRTSRNAIAVTTSPGIPAQTRPRSTATRQTSASSAQPATVARLAQRTEVMGPTVPGATLRPGRSALRARTRAWDEGCLVLLAETIFVACRMKFPVGARARDLREYRSERTPRRHRRIPV